MSRKPVSERYIVALDFGTTFSGVAFARKSFPDDVFLIHQWPSQEEAAMPYCKTPSALWYTQEDDKSWKARAWGWPAVAGYTRAADAARRNLSKTKSEKPAGYITKRFKLSLSKDGTPEIEATLPPGITADRAIADYLRGMAEFVLGEMHRNFGPHVQMKEVEWALTVPAIWGEKAKQKMQDLAGEAGMTVQGSSPLSIILEPEAASTYCHHKQSVKAVKGDRLLVLDAGGGTVDIVVHEKLGDGAEVREVTRISGGLCGSSYVDDSFFDFLFRRISCLSAYIKQDPSIVGKLLKLWDEIKRTFSGDERVKYFDVPNKLSSAWEQTGDDEPDFDVIELTSEVLMGIFDPIVNRVLDLVREQLSATKCKAILAVGGFSENAYLIKKLIEKFQKTGLVQLVVVPPNPGAAICHGALLQKLHPCKILSRIARRTYGVAILALFKPGIHPANRRLVLSNGEVRCNNVFSVFVRNGEAVDTSAVIKKRQIPMEATDKQIIVAVYSSESKSPTFVDEPGVVLEGTITVDMPDTKLGKKREVEICMAFGKTCIEVMAHGVNFREGSNSSKLPVRFAA